MQGILGFNILLRGYLASKFIILVYNDLQVHDFVSVLMDYFLPLNLTLENVTFSKVSGNFMYILIHPN